jgi:hypothetical protein
MTDFRRPFGPDDLPDSGESPADIARALATGRELDAMAGRDAASPSGDFVDRVMTALASEPTPRPVAAAGRAVREGRLAGALAAFRDTWRVAFSGGRPLAVRAQALALVLVAVVAVGTLGGAAAVGALGLLDRPTATETVQPSASPTSPVASPSASPSPSPSPSASPSPTPSQSAAPTASPTGTETAEPTDLETETPEPTGTDDSDDSDDGTPKPTETPKPGETPRPTEPDD